MLERRAVVRFVKSFGVGVCTFTFDLILLFLFIDVLHIHYVFSASIAFIIATSTNYVISRRYVFPGSERSVHEAYLIFVSIGGVGLLFIASLMYLLVGVFGLHYMVSRVMVASVVGVWNYAMNLYVNFRVAGKGDK